MTASSHLVTIERFSRRLSISPEFLRDQIAQGVLPALRVGDELYLDAVVAESILRELALGGAIVRLSTLRETARYIGKPPHVLRAMAEAGEVPAFRLGRSWGFVKEHVGGLLLRRAMTAHETAAKMRRADRQGSATVASGTTTPAAVSTVVDGEKAECQRSEQ